MQVVDITLAEQASTNITSLRMVQQKHGGPKYKLIHIYYIPKRDDTEMLPVKRTPQVLSVYSNWKAQIIKQRKNSATYSYPTVARFLGYGTTLLVSSSSLRLFSGGCSVANEVVHTFDAAREIWLLVEDVLLAFNCIQGGLIEFFTV
jgi:hypothetical protein